MEQHRVSETWPGSEADVRERVLWGGDVSEEAQSELFLRKFTVSSIDKEYKPIISNNLHPKHIHTLLSNIFQLLHIHFRLAIIIFPPMKERITRMMHRSLPGHSSGSKRKGDQQLQTVLSNSKIHSEQSSLERLIEEFPLLDALLNDSQTSPEKSKPKPTVVPRGPPTKIQQLKMVYNNYYPVHEDPEEMSRIVSAMRAAALTNRPDFYLQAVHEQYAKLGGSRSLCELQQKLQADLIYLIRRDNQRSLHERQKYC